METESEQYEDIWSITTETVNKVTKSQDGQPCQLFAAMQLRNNLVKFQLDCGATCNIIPINLVNPDVQIQKTDQVLVMYNKSTLKPVGKCHLKFRNPCNKKLYRLEFMVIDAHSTVPLLGSRAVQGMKLVEVQSENILVVDNVMTRTDGEDTVGQWTMKQITGEFIDIFTGDGCLPGHYKIEIDQGVEPVKLPKRRIPVAMMGPLKEELDNLHERGIITPVEHSTDWISSLIVVKKPSSKLRICIDPRPLNKALKRSHFPLPTIEDILPELSKAKVFTVCDVKNGFWHVQLDNPSSYLTTFATPYGRYRWLRMPLGISPAPEVFQRMLNQALEGLQGVHIIADDVLITGEGETLEMARKDDNEKLRLFLDRCRERNIKLNVDKFRLRQSEVTYIGHLLTSEGLKVDPEKVWAIKEMPRPTDVKGVQRILSMVNYLSKFCRHLSDHCEVLRQLTHKDSLWDWSEIHEQAFKNIKDLITKAPVLRYYSLKEQLVLQCDASETGLGAALLQSGEPVAFGSHALSLTEWGYAQIEKECLAIVYGMEKFHQYTYGRKVIIQFDHKPLESIVKKPLLHAPKRLQRMLKRLQKYDFIITYVPGKEMLLADALSRAYLEDTAQEGSVEKEVESVNMIQYLPISEERINVIRSETAKDDTLQTLIKTLREGWPTNRRDIPSKIDHYYSIQDELSIQDGIVFKGERVVIPDALRSDTIQRVHSAHLGIEGCLRRARECLYWPGMNAQIKGYIEKCDLCRTLGVKQQKESLYPHELPERPWSKVGTDLFVFNNRDYLITVDYFSNFWELDYFQDTKSSTVINKLKAHFARQGIPDIVFSDNGPQYTSTEFQQFSRRWEFQHKTSSPTHPQSNGKAESAVKTAKRLMQRAKMAGQDPYLAILDHRNTPSQGLNASPAQRLLSRRTRTLLPTHNNLLKPKVMDTTHGLRLNQRRQEMYYNRHAKDMTTVTPGDKVRVQPTQSQKAWQKATVIEPVNKRSYKIELDSGGVLRRNRRYLKHTGHQDLVIQQEQCAENSRSKDHCAQPIGDTKHTVTTRSGRINARPQYLKDYVT
ncbi:uncharacterized protein K02A2.6-like [Erpetoichthys calabaricus]|uniref:uncharacterized protein K02A2.6-like n=1 Tax=Erpetoichthys calabaricus TaxID=27687 RepID=UPI0022341794|nr:uncharacterized protein K02A2.6-like [Erpetoichthys calabaricus]